MGETADEIERHIEHRRKDLGANLQELERKVKSVTDWRTGFQKKPWLWMGVAFCGGLLLAAFQSRRGHREPPGGDSACQPCG